MHSYKTLSLLAGLLVISAGSAFADPLPNDMLKIMNQDKYRHASWGIYAKDAESGKILYDLNSDKMVLPASTTKLFTIAALLHTYGDDYRFKTPVYAIGDIKNGVLNGTLILVAQGDLTFGGRQTHSDTIEFTKLDHTIANNVPGVTITAIDPLKGLKGLAKQIKDAGIKEINGNVIIDDSLFETIVKREMTLSPIVINENMIDFIINPTENNKPADLKWRPHAPNYTVTNELKTVAKDEPTDIQITADESGQKITVKGNVSEGQKDLIRTLNISNPKHFAHSAFIAALQSEGIAVNVSDKGNIALPSPLILKGMKPIAIWVSPPLSEYAKLVLKVSHNYGADLVPLLLAAREGKTTFAEGMLLLGNFVTDVVKVPYEAYVFVDGAGADANRSTLQAEIQMLEFMRKQPPEHFKKYYDALPILGVDGSLADFGKTTNAVGKARAKPGTGISYNMASGKLFLTTQTYAGYIEGKNGHLIEYMLSINNGNTPKIEDVPGVFEDLGLLTGIIYETSP